MFFSRKLILLIVFFACLGSFISYTGLHADKNRNDSITVQSNFLVPGWKGRDLHNLPEVLKALQANITVFSDYSQNDNNTPPVNLYVGYYDSLEKSKLSHAPQVCFTAQGWILKEDSKILLNFGDKKKEVNRLVLEKEKKRLLVYYWYQTKNEVYADLYKMKLHLLYRKLTEGRTAQVGNAFVRVLTSVTGERQLEEHRLQSFIDDARQPVKRLMDSL